MNPELFCSLSNVIEGLASVDPERIARAENELQFVRDHLKSATPERSAHLLSFLTTAGELARRANEFWEFQRAAHTAKETQETRQEWMA